MLMVSMLVFFLCSSVCGTNGVKDERRGQTRSRKVLADLTSNKLTREHDGSYGLWSFHGLAMESHADEREFTYSADLLSHDGRHHVSIASVIYPWMGLTSDQDPIFQEFLILQAKTSGIDGFLLEWGYRNHSSDLALQQLLRIANNYEDFTVGINWCDHWLTKDLKNRSSQEVIDAFHSNLQYLVDNVFVLGPDVVLYYDNHPIIFIFGGGLTSKQFRAVLSKPLSLPSGMDTPIWIGSYLNFGEWDGLLNGTFGWAPYVERPTPANMSEWDYYGTLEDAVMYQKNLSKFGSDCVDRGSCVLWCGSVSPGFDNRGCAGWGKSLRYIPRSDLQTHTRKTYDAQWNYYINLDDSPDFILIPTMNDFPEATTILPLSPTFDTLFSTAWLSSMWKNTGVDTSGVSLPASWFSLYSQAIFYQRIPHVNVSHIIAALEKASSLINKRVYAGAGKCILTARKYMHQLESQLKVSNMTLDLHNKGLYPSFKPVVADGAYIVSKTVKLFLAVKETKAALLREANFKGLLRFEYFLQKRGFSHLRVLSATSRRDVPVWSELIASKYPQSQLQGDVYVRHADFGEVCDIMVTSSGTWQSAVVAVHKVNQAWDHSAKHSSDLYFVADNSFSIRNISLEFQIFTVDPS